MRDVTDLNFVRSWLSESMGDPKHTIFCKREREGLLSDTTLHIQHYNCQTYCKVKSRYAVHSFSSLSSS